MVSRELLITYLTNTLRQILITNIIKHPHNRSIKRKLSKAYEFPRLDRRNWSMVKDLQLTFDHKTEKLRKLQVFVVKHDFRLTIRLTRFVSQHKKMKQ